MKKSIKQPSLLDALIPVVSLILMMGCAVYLYGGDSSYGPNRIALMLAAGMTAVIGLKNGHSWEDIEQGIVSGISMALGACLILLAVGALIGTWMLAGTVPTLIYFGLEMLAPSFFYTATCLICMVVAMSIGSSWNHSSHCWCRTDGRFSGHGYVIGDHSRCCGVRRLFWR